MGWSELVESLRDNFERKYEENIKKGVYDQRDVDRIRDDFKFARSFIRGRERIEEGTDLINSSLTFKNEFKIHDATEDMFDKEMLQLGAIYFRARDINGSRILWLKVKLHRKDASSDYLSKEKLGIACGLEKALNEEPLKPIVVVLDMTGCGLVNMDIDFVKYIITCFKFYYPTFLEYMLIYDMPWIFNAAWKIVKAWLSTEAAAKIKFVTKNNIKEFISAESLPIHMGGNDDYKFVYTPGMSLEPLYPPEDKHDEKKVTFESPEPVVEEVLAPTKAVGSEATPHPPPSAPQQTKNSVAKTPGQTNNTNNHTAKAPSSNSSGLRHRNSSTNSNNSSNSDKMSKLITSRKSSISNTFVGKYLSVSPADQLSFHVDSTGDAYDVIILSNTLSMSVAFKVKTTSPEKYRVRPSSGIVQPGKTDEVFVYLTEEHKQTTTVKDKFLIMAMEVADEHVEDTAKLWRDSPKDSIMEHRLKCVTASQAREVSHIAHPMEPPKSNLLHPVDVVEAKIVRLEQQNRQIQGQLRILLFLQIISVIFFIGILFSYSCLGEELFSKYLIPPFGVCTDSYGRRF